MSSSVTSDDEHETEEKEGDEVIIKNIIFISKCLYHVFQSDSPSYSVVSFSFVWDYNKAWISFSCITTIHQALLIKFIWWLINS